MPRITERQWLEYFGFQRSPFALWDAESEFKNSPGIFSSTFVEPQFFDQLLGQPGNIGNSLVYGAAGMGKTKLNLMLDYYYSQTDYLTRGQAAIIVVPYTNIEQVIQATFKSGESEGWVAPPLERHLFEILCQAIQTFSERYLELPKIRSECRQLHKTEKIDLVRMHREYAPFLSSDLQHLIWQTTLPDLLDTYELNDFLPGSFERRSPETSQPGLEKTNSDLMLFLHLCSRAGIENLVVVLDNLDRIDGVPHNPYLGYLAVQSLLESLDSLTRNSIIKFKLFAPEEMAPYIKNTSDKHPGSNLAAYHLDWSAAELLEIIHRRLEFYKTSTETDRFFFGFDALCTPDLRGRIESDLIHISGHNPRAINWLCHRMIQHHLERETSRQGDIYQLTADDFQQASANYQDSQQEISALEFPRLELEVRFIQDLVSKGESNRLEFKSGLRWDYKLKSANKTLAEVVARSIAAFMNAEGGQLLIGVTPDGGICGIESDLIGIKTESLTDGFELLLRNHIRQFLGDDKLAYIRLNFVTTTAGRVAIVSIAKAPEPVFFKIKDSYEFYVRVGNTTQRLDVRSTVNYVKYHWS